MENIEGEIPPNQQLPPMSRRGHSRLFSTNQISRYKRCQIRTKSIQQVGVLARDLIEVAAAFVYGYPVTEESNKELPNYPIGLLREIKSVLPIPSRLFSAEYFHIPLAPVGLLKYIADLYNLPNPFLISLPKL